MGNSIINFLEYLYYLPNIEQRRLIYHLAVSVGFSEEKDNDGQIILYTSLTDDDFEEDKVKE